MPALISALNNVIINPLLLLLFAAGVLVFVVGVAEFFFNFDVRGDQHAKEKGKAHMIWGLVGMFVMASAFAIINVLVNTVNSFNS